MCGIAGYYDTKLDFSNDLKNNLRILKNMIKSMKMRGPDSDDFSIIGNCCLAHTRLSIIAPDSGSQPMSVAAGGNTYHIVYNGEIYNHPQLKRELMSSGYSFDTASDTEVLLKAFIHWGPGFVERLNGIFAIAIYDEALKTLYLARDHFGVKPLYYTRYKDTLIFSSRIDTLFEYPRVHPFIDISSFNEIFTLGPSKTCGKGVFKNVFEVLPGEYIKYSPQGYIKKRYYSLKSTPHTDSVTDTIEKTAYLLEKSIKSQMISDVPVCTFLSGGIDSSYVSSVCAANQNTPLATFSFDFEGNDTHFKANSFQVSMDRPYIDCMVKYLKSNHTYLSCDSQALADLLYESVDSRCLPTMADVDSSLLYFCRLVSGTHKCCLTGECADEIFGGYPWFHREDMLNNPIFPWIQDLSFKKSLLNPEFVGALNMDKYLKCAYDDCVSEVEILPEESEADKKRRIITYLNIRYFMQTLLDRMDRTSMASGLEARVPFADRELIDYVYNVPWEIKNLDGIPKGLLRAAAKAYLPDEIMNRPKNPYPKTYNPAYENILKERLTEVINDSSSPIVSYLNIENVRRFISSPKEYGRPWYGQLMAGPQMMAYLLQINYWMKKYSLSL
jgi:asparagine synthase (glutamine-hydrolysing)